jgi:hypothetical protein
MRELLIQTMHILAAQAPGVDPIKGAPAAYAGAQARIAEPHMYDMVFPVIALFLVILIPSAVALWVAWKTITDTTLEDGQA